jgi:hypothetical protein
MFMMVLRLLIRYVFHAVAECKRIPISTGNRARERGFRKKE